MLVVTADPLDVAVAADDVGEAVPVVFCTPVEFCALATAATAARTRWRAAIVKRAGVLRQILAESGMP
jgi:hypothetical protein